MPIKCLHLGVTETYMLLLLGNEHLVNSKTRQLPYRLWSHWNGNGFYDRKMRLPIDDREDMTWDAYMTQTARAYWELYRKSCDNADRIVHLKVSIEVANNVFDDGRARVEALFDTLPVPPLEVSETFSYQWIKDCASGHRVIVVSPFAELIRSQMISGKMAQLRPDFTPEEVRYFTFPYCFGNKGPHENALETVAAVTEALLPEVGPDTSVMLSCGSMGVPIAAKLHEAGANVFYCGGAMQLFFGIMGGRWRNPSFSDRALDPADRLLDSYRTTPELWIDPAPDSYVPSNSKTIENGCYW